MSRDERLKRIAASRVYLRTPVLADHAEYATLLRASEEFHRPWFPTRPPGFDPYAPEVFEQFVNTSGLASRRERRFVCSKVDDRLLGAANLSEIVRGCFQSCYLGYWMGAPFAGQGYMAEAIQHVIELAFVDLCLHRIEANIRPENEPSTRLVKSAGFRKEGYSPRYLEIDGAWRDHERWALLSDSEPE